MGVCNGYQLPVLVHNQRDSIYQPRIPKPAGDRVPFDMRADLDEAKRCHRVSASRVRRPCLGARSSQVRSASVLQRLISAEQIDEFAERRKITDLADRFPCGGGAAVTHYSATPLVCR